MSNNAVVTITEFLEARIAEDEADAINRVVLSFENRRSLTSDDAERAHAECAAKRAILDYHAMLLQQSEQNEVFGYHATGLRVAIRKLASVYSDHPDYREEWA